MQENEWKLLVRFMLAVLAAFNRISLPIAAARVEADQLKDDLEVELKR